MRICVIGLGKLGLPIASAFASQGFDVIGVDSNESLVQSLQDRSFKTDEPDVSLEGIDFRTQVPSYCQAAFICVQTPSKPDGSFDDQYVRKAVASLKEKVSFIIAIVSTLMPGQSRAIMNEFEVRLFYSPTFIRLGSVVKDFLNPDVRIIGCNEPWQAEILAIIYNRMPRAPMKLMSLESAEIAKLAINCFITTKIAYANQLQMLCEATPNSDVDDVTEAMGMDSRIGPKYLKAGMPFGGPCFPRDVKAFKNKVAEVMNDLHATHLAKMIQDIGKPYRSILILGSSYKSGTVLEECSPAKMLTDWIAYSEISDKVSDIEKSDVIVISTQDPRWLQEDYRDKVVFDPWGYFKDHGIVCKQLITPGRRR